MVVVAHVACLVAEKVEVNELVIADSLAVFFQKYQYSTLSMRVTISVSIPLLHGLPGWLRLRRFRPCRPGPWQLPAVVFADGDDRDVDSSSCLRKATPPAEN